MINMEENAKTTEKREIKDYTKYSFGPGDILQVEPQVLDMVRNFVNEVLTAEGVGISRVTTPRYTFMHNETGLPAKSGTKKEELDRSYTRTYDHAKTMSAAVEELILPLGKKSLAILEILNFTHKQNLDNGVGDTIENIKARMAAEEKASQDQESSSPEHTEVPEAPQESGPQDPDEVVLVKA